MNRKGMSTFRTRKFDSYGKLSHQSIDELRIGSRIEVGDKKTRRLRLCFVENGEGRRNFLESLHGEMAVQAGILNAQQWRRNTSVIQLIFMQVGKI